MSDFLARRALFWAPRVLSIVFVAFLSLFATDVFDAHRGFWPTLQALGIHLIPTLVLIVALILAWRREWIGAVVYAVMAVLYILWVTTMRRPVPAATRLSWAIMIAGPALLIAGLFLANWRKHDELRTLRH
jgi:hypothetical protein